MATEAETALAFVARRSGTSHMPRSRWGHVLAFDLGWMNPGQARAYIDACVAAGLFEEQGDELRLRIDAAHVEVPRGFRPDPNRRPEPATLAPGPVDDPFIARLDALARATGQSRADVLAKLAQAQESVGGLLDAEAALLWLMRAAGLDVGAEAKVVLEARLSGSGA